MGLLEAPAHLIKILKLGYRDMVKRKKMRLRHGDVLDAVSYTHLTLPTIYSV